MSKFVKFAAKGFIFDRDKNGRPRPKIVDRRYGGGVTRNTPDLMGKVFMQCPDLLPCDEIIIRTYPIG